MPFLPANVYHDQCGAMIISSITAISSQSENPLLTEILTDVAKELEAGKTFSEACYKHKDVFPNIFISMVEAGEASGSLDVVLNRLAEYFENQSEIREKVKSATTYPMVIGIVAVVVVIALLTTVIPGFADMFAQAEQELPGITVAMLTLSDIIKNTFHPHPGNNYCNSCHSEMVRYYQGPPHHSKVELKVPKFGVIFRNSAIGRFCRSLSVSSLAAGSPWSRPWK